MEIATPLLVTAVLLYLIYRFRDLFRALDFFKIILIDRRQWRSIKRKGLAPYYFLFLVFAALVVFGAVYKILSFIQYIQNYNRSEN